MLGLVLWYINHYRLFNAKSTFIHIVIFQTIQFSMSTQSKCQKHSDFKPFSLVNKVKWFQLLLCITNNSIKQSFVYKVKYKNSSISNNSV